MANETENNSNKAVLDFQSFKKSKENIDLRPGSEFVIPNLGHAANFGLETLLPWVKIVRGETGHGDRDNGYIEAGKTVTVMGTSKEFGVLCRYDTNTIAHGTNLISGSMFFIDPFELLYWPEMIKEQEQERKRKEAEVERILAETQKTESIFTRLFKK